MSLVNNLDLAFFYYGLAYVLMAAVCLSLRRDDRKSLPWAFLGLFGVLLGSVAWLNLIAISFGDSAAGLYLRIVMMASAFVCLVEFGRAGIAASARFAGRWIHIPLILLALSGALGDEQSIKLSPRYALALPGGILAAVALFRASRHGGGRSRLLQAASGAMLLVALTSGLIGSSASFFPASVLNQDAFLGLTGVPLPVVRSGLAVLIVVLLALYYRRARRRAGVPGGVTRTAPFGPWLIPSLLAVLAVGWIATVTTGNRIGGVLINASRTEARYAAAALDPDDVAAIWAAAKDESLPASDRIRAEISRLCTANTNIMGIMILPTRGGRIGPVGDQDALSRAIYHLRGYGEELVGRSVSGGRPVGEGIEYFDTGEKAWVRVRVPLTTGGASARSGADLAVDIDARTWEQTIYKARTGPLGTMLLLTLALIALDLARERSRQVSHQIAESERRYRSLVEGSPNCIQLLSQDGRILSINRNGVETLGWNEAQVLGKRLSEIWPERERVRMEPALDSAASGKQAELEATFVRRDGREIRLAVVLNPIFDTQGAVRCFVGIFTDISERKRAELENEKLEEQLRQSKKMESIGRLAGGVAHDFNNVLTAMIGYAELAFAHYQKQDYVREKLQGIIEAGERAVRLTRQLLAFSRKQVLEMSVLNLNDTVTRMENMLCRLIGEDVRIQAVLEEGLHGVRADVAQLEQVLMNLSVNARDAMPKGGVLTIETKNVILDEEFARTHAGIVPGPHVMLSVSDTGSGMDSETISHVFEPFFTTKERGAGIGLGLATVYGIVKQHGGSIWVYSEPGVGSTFKIYFPAAEGERVEVVETPTVKSSGDRGNETVLVVEDEDTVRRIVAETLEGHGYITLSAADATEALSIAQSHAGDIQLMVTDVIMPKMNGKELRERMAVIRPQTKVLFVSGYTDEVIVHHGLLDPGVNFLQKPICAQTLLHKVRAVLDG